MMKPAPVPTRRPPPTPLPAPAPPSGEVSAAAAAPWGLKPQAGPIPDGGGGPDSGLGGRRGFLSVTPRVGEATVEEAATSADAVANPLGGREVGRGA